MRSIRLRSHGELGVSSHFQTAVTSGGRLAIIERQVCCISDAEKTAHDLRPPPSSVKPGLEPSGFSAMKAGSSVALCRERIPCRSSSNMTPSTAAQLLPWLVQPASMAVQAVAIHCPDVPGAANAVTRTNAAMPTAIAPMMEKTNRQVSDGIVCLPMP